jgi:hypothetical protein
MPTEPPYVESLEKMLTRAQASELGLIDQNHKLLEKVEFLERRLYGYDDSSGLDDYKRDCFRYQKEVAALKEERDDLLSLSTKVLDLKEAWKAAAEHMAKSVDSYRYEGYVQWCDKLTELLRVARELEKD